MRSHLKKHAFTLHLLLEGAKSLFDIVVTPKTLPERRVGYSSGKD